MSAKQNKPGCISSLVFLGVIVAIFIATSGDKKESSRTGQSPRSTSVTHTASVPDTPVRNPIEEMLTIRSQAGKQPGVVLAIGIDTSGSMSQSVRDGSGNRRPKIEIARQCLQRISEQIAAFAEQNPDRTVHLGIFEFSSISNKPSCRPVVPLGAVDPSAVSKAVARLKAVGGTPIGDAMVAMKRKLDAAGFQRMHLLVITDGENTVGYSPADVAEVMSRQAEEHRAGVYFVAFDVAAEKFTAVRDAGVLVLPAANELELQQTMDYVLTGKVLAEQLPTPKK